MCPIWPLHLIIIYLLALCPLWVFCQAVPNLLASFTPDLVSVHMDDYYYVDVAVSGTGMQPGDSFGLSTVNNHIATGEWNSTYQLIETTDRWEGRIRVRGNFLGRTDLSVEGRRGAAAFPVNNSLPVVVTRPVRVIDRVFTSSVATFVSLIFINFGCAMHWPTVKEVVKKPIGPAIGMVGQFLFMPLISFGLGFLIFPDTPEMRLGMFFTGVSPGGGASNIWTFILGGNLNLSLAMTSMSTLLSFAVMPAWLFSLGQVVFANANIGVPYTRIATFVIGLLVPLGIGLAMQKWTPKLAAFMVRILKGFSTTLLLFIIVFAIVTNLYIFELFTWQIIVAGMGIPWLGYMFGYALARILKQPHADALAISIETGIQNTGISIFLLRYALDQPEADLTTVVPVSVAIMTPIPMTCIYIYQKIAACVANRNQHRKIVEDLTPVSERVEPDVVAAADVEKRS
ncbi:ileal sodium/bile acid cotransporter [Amyelois transitella]|uniref:ileal sodium/bile acid cotransporter n=1 Tax=Amyelois transitella TaxID=680683 RepID=UPI00298FFF58|nr:ileal sodium/bile acid cotransporter [Amyelois transitella]XP_060806939.1 ileal sodium/bile acid cotransporter [Amyelois transitella]XP_060806940.1 ileal sodium/bile acid cotransporter [Amyelois transitella]XP_060806941.1 ileal sodium/bile acid cotransporter [Amyelois transitella]